jgi:ubiquinone/menaquinone biosynthesis C-methylase UbiE
MKKKIIKKNNKKIIIKNNINNIHTTLIPKTSYFHFLDEKYKNEFITECEMKLFKKLYLNQEYNIIPVQSNHQISEFFKLIIKDETTTQYQIYRFSRLISNFIQIDDILNLIQKIKQNPNISDSEVIKWMQHTIDHNNKTKKKYNHDIMNDKEAEKIVLCKRDEYVFQIIIQNLKNALKYKIKVYSYNKTSDIKYLDVGCGDGIKTVSFSKILKLPINQVYGTDIETWGPYSKKKMYPFDFKPISENGHLNYADNTFDIITSFLTLHHIQNLDITLSEIKRILKPNGILLIIEHECFNKYDFFIVYIQHLLYNYMYDIKNNPNEWKNRNYIQNPTFQKYYNFVEWDFILLKHGFTFMVGKTISENLSDKKTYDNQFFSIYQIKK